MEETRTVNTDQSFTRTLKDLSSGAAGGIAQVLLGMYQSLNTLPEALRLILEIICDLYLAYLLRITPWEDQHVTRDLKSCGAIILLPPHG